VTPDQVLAAAFIGVVLVLVVVGGVRIATRRRGANEDAFGAGGVTKVPVGTTGVVRTALAPSGVVYLLGEQWSARSRTEAPIPVGGQIRVVGHDGLTLIVDSEPTNRPAAQ
jgi:membrane-bound ClpP family serine protease